MVYFFYMQPKYTLTAAEAQLLSHINSLSSRECEISSLYDCLKLPQKVIERAIEGLLVKGLLERTGEKLSLAAIHKENYTDSL